MTAHAPRTRSGRVPLQRTSAPRCSPEMLGPSGWRCCNGSRHGSLLSLVARRNASSDSYRHADRAHLTLTVHIAEPVHDASLVCTVAGLGGPGLDEGEPIAAGGHLLDREPSSRQ